MKTTKTTIEKDGIRLIKQLISGNHLDPQELAELKSFLVALSFGVGLREKKGRD